MPEEVLSIKPRNKTTKNIETSTYFFHSVYNKVHGILTIVAWPISKCNGKIFIYESINLYQIGIFNMIFEVLYCCQYFTTLRLFCNAFGINIMVVYQFQYENGKCYSSSIY